MRTCPLCETAVAGPSCEVCGHTFAAPAGPAAPVPGLEELEPRPAPIAAVPVAPLLELEPTRFPAAPAPLPAVVLDLPVEATRAAAAPDVAAGGLLDIDRGREAEEERTPQPSGPAPCRYCRHVQAVGRICDRCGMRLPAGQAAVASVHVTLPEGLVRCRSCGERTPPGGRCPSCGAVLVTQA